jgi:hypothetical protein
MSALLKARGGERPIVLHDLVLGRYSVHTTPAALAAGESQIHRIGNQLVAAGMLR